MMGYIYEEIIKVVNDVLTELMVTKYYRNKSYSGIMFGWDFLSLVREHLTYPTAALVLNQSTIALEMIYRVQSFYKIVCSYAEIEWIVDRLLLNNILNFMFKFSRLFNFYY